MQENQPRDKKGNIITVGVTLRAHSPDGRDLRYKVIASDHLHGSGSVELECEGPVEPGWERRWESRSLLWQVYEIEASALEEKESNS